MNSRYCISVYIFCRLFIFSDERGEDELGEEEEEEEMLDFIDDLDLEKDENPPPNPYLDPPTNADDSSGDETDSSVDSTSSNDDSEDEEEYDIPGMSMEEIPQQYGHPDEGGHFRNIRYMVCNTTYCSARLQFA